MATNKMREEEVKNRLRQEFFADYDATPILGDIDFAVTTRREQGQTELFDREFFLWAEAKAGTSEDIYASFVQLIITIGKAHTHERLLPPRYLGAFDEEKIAFLEFHHIVPVFYQNDFNWNVTPSNHQTREFRQLYQLLHDTLQKEISRFHLRKDEKDLRGFIRKNFRTGGGRTSGINITKNNFIFVFQRWVEEVKPSIVADWTDIPPSRVVDFFYADLISCNDYTMGDELAVVLRGDQYKIIEQFKKSGKALFSEAQFNDGMAAYRQFWNKYNRPPRKEYLDIIRARRDLLFPQDLRKYKGAFYTPPIWVQKSQEYIAAELGEDWQENYYVWDCCAGTGNLLYGLTDPYRIYASTLDTADVQIMKERISEKSLNLLEAHVFQFDFLNDKAEKLPKGLRDILIDPEKRRRLVIYINPPFGEAGSSYTRKAKTGISNTTTVHKDYAKELGKYAKRELFIQFFMRIYKEFPGVVLAEFSKLKHLQSPYFRDFRQTFQARLGRSFIVPAESFDNVTGTFPIGFFIWHTDIHEVFEQRKTDTFNKKGEMLFQKTLLSYDGARYINDWLRPTWQKNAPDLIGIMVCNGNDFQHYKEICILSKPSNNTSTFFKPITKRNLLLSCIYLAVRKSVEPTWHNDRDQFLWPNDSWKGDKEFQSDCLVFSLFTDSNNIKSAEGINHWIPFTEAEVGAKDAFESHFMHDYITGRLSKAASATPPQQLALAFGDATSAHAEEKANSGSSVKSGDDKIHPMTFSGEATTVLDAARALWRYYHAQPDATPDASYYDIRLYFQGTKLSKSGKQQLNPDSSDAHYTALLQTLRQTVKALAKKIEPKVYEYGFLKQ